MQMQCKAQNGGFLASLTPYAILVSSLDPPTKNIALPPMDCNGFQSRFCMEKIPHQRGSKFLHINFANLPLCNCIKQRLTRKLIS